MKRKAIKKMKNISQHIKQRRKKTTNKKAPAPKNEPLWNSDLDLKGNFKNLHLTYDLNKIDKLSNKHLTDIVGPIEVEEEYTLAEIQQINEGNYTEPKGKITQDEGFLVKNLYKKHGENFEKMEMDHKVNKMQWNAHQAKKKFDAYKKKVWIFGR